MLKDIINKLESNESVIIDDWINASEVQKVLSDHIAPEYFKTQYAHGILSYFFDVVRGLQRVGDCPTMNQFLKHCSLEGFKITDVYAICINLRHSVINILLKNNMLDTDVYKELNNILDNNLSGVFELYNQLLVEKDQVIDDKSMWINQYEKIIDDVLIVSKTDLNGRITFANDNFCKVSGYTRSELIGKSHNIVRHPDMPSINYKNMWKTIKSKKAWSGVLKNINKDGSSYYVGTVIIPIVDQGGHIIEYLSSRTDLTEIFSLQDYKEKADKTIVKQSSLAELGEMINAISHQWKQPLAVISTLVNESLLRNEFRDEPNQEDIETLNHIQEMVTHLSETVDSFRTFFKAEKVKQLINISELIEDIKIIQNAALKENYVKLTIDPSNSFELNIIAHELKQVVLVILNNSIDVLHDNEVKDAVINISFDQKDDYGYIIIEDNGGGIDESLLPEKLFEIYTTTKEYGTGVGLNICKRIVQNSLGGTISASNTSNGAQFTIELPLE